VVYRTKLINSSFSVVKLADLDNPLVGASIWGVSPAQAEL